MIHGPRGHHPAAHPEVRRRGAAAAWPSSAPCSSIPVTEQLLHVDLQEVSADKPITVRVAVHPVGEAIGVQGHEGHPQPRPARARRCPACRPPSPSGSTPTSRELAIGDVLTIADLHGPRGRAHPERPRPGGGDRVAADGGGSGGRRRATAAVTAEPEVLTERKPKEGEEAAARRRQEGRAAREGREGQVADRAAWPTWWWDSGTRARSTGTPATTWASACSTHLAAERSAQAAGSATARRIVAAGRWRGDAV